MKKIYITPIAKEIQISEEENLLAGSPVFEPDKAADDTGVDVETQEKIEDEWGTPNIG